MRRPWNFSRAWLWPESGPAAVGPESGPAAEFDWHAAEEEVKDLVGPAFVQRDPAAEPGRFPVAGNAGEPIVTLADVGGMETVKQRLNAAFLAPMNNPELKKL